MPRPKSYNRAEALGRACDVFWQHGYGAVGVRAIEEKTGLNQFAIRTEFGGKEGLYLAALELYTGHAEESALAPMSDGGIDGVAQFFDKLVDAISPTSSRWGCLIVNTGVENAKIANPKFADAVQRYWQSLSAHFATALQHSKDNGELVSSLDVTAAADTLLIAVMGIHTMNRIAGSPTAGTPMVKMIQEWIKGWRC